MFFESFRERIPFFNSKKTTRAKSKNRSIPLLNPSKEEAERLTLEHADQLLADKKYQKALEVINSTIENGFTTNQILHKKALALSHNKEFQEAHKIWDNLSKLKNKPKLANLAKQSLKTSKQIEAQTIKSTKILIDSLHAKATQFNYNLKHLPKSKNWSTNLNIISLVRKEAEQARIIELPKLSDDLINLTLHSGIQSPLLMNDKALSVGMMGKTSEALEILEKLKREIKNPQIQKLITDSKNTLKLKIDYYELMKSSYLVKQSRAAAQACKADIKLIPQPGDIPNAKKSKSLVFSEARNCLKSNPQASLALTNSILDYFPSDGSSLQLKGEALSALNQPDEAIQIWKALSDSTNKEISQRALKSISNTLTNKTLKISTKSPKEKIRFFIQEHLKLSIAPSSNKEIDLILEKTDKSNKDLFDPELKRHQLKLLFNSILIDCLEERLKDKTNK